MYIYNVRQTHDVECRATTTDANQIQMIKQRRGSKELRLVIARTPEHQVGGTVEQVPEEKRSLLLKFSLCLSRARLGKMFVLYTNCSKRSFCYQ